MYDRASFAYVQARLQARHGARPSEAAWRGLEASKNLGHFLHMARETSFEPWVRHFTPDSDPHGMEASLRADWKRYVKQVASWHPSQWRAAVEWTGGLIDLPAVAHLQGGHPLPPWMEDDPTLALSGSAFTPILRAMDRRRSPIQGWLDHWRRLWPEESVATRRSLEDLVRLFSAHLELISAANAVVSGEARTSLAARLIHIFRRGQQHPVAVYAHFGILALDLERLRSCLVRISLFPGMERGAA